MPLPRLDLDVAVETHVYRAVVAVLQGNPTLKRVIKTWEVLDGTHATIQPPATTGMPWLCVMPGPSQMTMAEAAAWGVDFTVLMVWCTAGLNGDDHMNLWNAIRAALGHSTAFRDTTVAEYLRLAHSPMGSFTHTISNPGLGPHPLPTRDRPAPDQDLMGTARVTLKFNVPF
jgi:hypothetical protein